MEIPVLDPTAESGLVGLVAGFPMEWFLAKEGSHARSCDVWGRRFESALKGEPLSRKRVSFIEAQMALDTLDPLRTALADELQPWTSWTRHDRLRMLSELDASAQHDAVRRTLARLGANEWSARQLVTVVPTHVHRSRLDASLAPFFDAHVARAEEGPDALLARLTSQELCQLWGVLSPHNPVALHVSAVLRQRQVPRISALVQRCTTFEFVGWMERRTTVAVGVALETATHENEALQSLRSHACFIARSAAFEVQYFIGRTYDPLKWAEDSGASFAVVVSAHQDSLYVADGIAEPSVRFSEKDVALVRGALTRAKWQVDLPADAVSPVLGWGAGWRQRYGSWWLSEFLSKMNTQLLPLY